MLILRRSLLLRNNGDSRYFGLVAWITVSFAGCGSSMYDLGIMSEPGDDWLVRTWQRLPDSEKQGDSFNNQAI